MAVQWKNAFLDASDELAEVKKERDELRAENEKLTKERDELRAPLERALNSALKKAKGE